VTKALARNPLRPFFDAVAVGGKPSTADLEREGFPRDRFDEVRRQCREVHALKAEGHHGAARRLAHDLAEDWLRRLPDDFSPPEPAAWPDTDDPRELADRIQRP
jgi:hypothetical protein